MNHFKYISNFARSVRAWPYYHSPQGVGKAFKAAALEGYFNDMTKKAGWLGLLDGKGMPLNLLSDGTTCYFPTAIIQKGLGHHDLYLVTGDKAQFAEFIKICDWLVMSQDLSGGWDVKKVMSLKDPFKYSAMSQGEAASALVRAWKLTRDVKYLKAAKGSIDIMLTACENGGSAYYRNGRLFLEEYPAAEKNTVLNGWIFAIFGLYDYFLAMADKDIKNVFYRSFDTIKSMLNTFDAGYWSFYDEKGALASPFYHDLHISQLEALFAVTKDEAIKNRIEKWKKYKRNVLGRARAVTIKIIQKLGNLNRISVIK